MKKGILLSLCLLWCVLMTGCTFKKDADSNISDNGSGSAVQADEESAIDYLLNNYTSIEVRYGYKVESRGSTGDNFSFVLHDEVAEFSGTIYEGGGYERRTSDFTTAKFDELRNILIAEKPVLYDVNAHADENGKIVYETLEPGIILYGKQSADASKEVYLLDIKDTSKIEDFCNNLYATSDVLESYVPSGENNNATNNVPGTPGTDSDMESYIEETAREKLDNMSPAQIVFGEGAEVTLSSTINVRSEKSETASKVAVAYAGEMLTILETDAGDGWAKVSYKGKEGYVRVEFLK